MTPDPGRQVLAVAMEPRDQSRESAGIFTFRDADDQFSRLCLENECLH